jgi:guanine nucleotide-binding protein alpha-1 subunit
MRPPPTETDNERRTRILREAEAQRVSQTIDDQIRQDRENFKKKKGDVKACYILSPVY